MTATNIIPGFLTVEEQQLIVEVAHNTVFKRCPSWLGAFDFKCFYNYSYKNSRLIKVIDHLATIRPEQKFNTVFLQRYKTADYVGPHRDPKNNVGVTIIGIAGLFTGATSHCEPGLAYQIAPGDVAVQDCTIDGVQGPRHRVSPVLSGTRYALILNTII